MGEKAEAEAAVADTEVVAGTVVVDTVVAVDGEAAGAQSMALIGVLPGEDQAGEDVTMEDGVVAVVVADTAVVVASKSSVIISRVKKLTTKQPWVESSTQ
jgi:hypothetical protein